MKKPSSIKANHGVHIAFLICLLLLTACVETDGKALLRKRFAFEVEMDGWVYNRDKGTPTIAQEMTKMVMDSRGIVMYELTLKPGDTLDWHEHPYHTTYVLEGGTLSVFYEDGSKEVLKLHEGNGFWGLPSADITINTGETTVKLLVQDIYSLGPTE